MNFEENKTAKSYFTVVVHCHLFSVTGLFWSRSSFIFRSLSKSGKRKETEKALKWLQKKPKKPRQRTPKTKKRWQQTSQVWFSSLIFFKIHFISGEWDTCARSSCSISLLMISFHFRSLDVQVVQSCNGQSSFTLPRNLYKLVDELCYHPDLVV